MDEEKKGYGTNYGTGVAEYTAGTEQGVDKGNEPVKQVKCTFRNVTCKDNFPYLSIKRHIVWVPGLVLGDTI